MITALADGQLLADKTGKSPAKVVALHGWGRSGADFAEIVEGLDAIAIHFPGFGITPEPSEAWGSEEYAESLAAALAGGGPYVFVAHSFGGRVVTRLAARHPELVSGIVLTGVPLMRLTAAPKPALGFRIVKKLAGWGLIPKSVLEKQRNARGSADYRAAQGVMRGVLVRVVGEDYREDLAKITVPVRMVWGALDDAAPADAGQAASELIPNATFRSIPGAGHLLEGELRTAVRADLLELISEVQP